ncbi:NPCBM/NEW2 domain-containing protein [Sulfuriroseicoccus oceanibius]|uniref:NPCBM/NEW2 domain-containing protein n=1 Tax=Sulfuriroseicoccus oceanibius TaxID=2707525 RepID=A0A6B3L9X8_9BACT|nr:NPCBM/NEW2 domain-containing protein [Sulfuriroseicoccus oceanibius]QQL44278.1 NPCBM/NEW2 domain-containing protein [Sulfuriroseicoccus oceanibius]
MIKTIAFSTMIASAITAAQASPATDILQGTQTYGAAKINESSSGGKLTIAGKTYEKGIGVHATSEIPLSIPKGVSSLTGLAGIDDNAAGPGKVQFRILSGSSVLWESPEISHGDAAVAFDVAVPSGARKLYLQVDELENNAHDHANWVDLKWKDGDVATKAATTFKGADFGLKPNVTEDQAPAFHKALDALRSAPGSTLVLEKGTYHFHHSSAIKRHYHPSNHDQPIWQPVCVPLVDLMDVTIDAQGSLFLFQGKVAPMFIQDTDGLTIKGLALDYVYPPDSQCTVTKVTPEFYEMTIDQQKFPHRVENGWITFTGENWEKHDGSHGIVFSGKTGEIVAGTSDYGYRGKLTVIADGHYRVEKNVQKDGIVAGDTITMRHGWGRPHPGVVMYRAKDTVLEDFVIHASQGMSLVAQRSENVHIKGGGVFPREGTGRNFSAGADATHFSNCKGVIITDGALYEGMMDDAINVHATCLRIEEKIDANTIRCRYVHGQAYGFEVVMPGETINFLQAKWLTPRDPSKVKAVNWIDNKNLILTLETPIPDDLGPGDALENADWHPSVHFKNNIVRNNRARGSLFTTPHPVIVENNTFETIAGSAILLAGDANGWYESGACYDVVIRNNTFKNNLTSRFQFTEAIISIFPEVPDLKGQKEFYHRNVRIEDNVFETFDVPLVFAISTDGLTFTGNQVSYNNDYPAWNKPPFILRRAANVTVKDNTVKDAPRQWTKENSFDLHLTPAEEITFE